MGGSNSEDNLVYLTAEEHYVAHQLLVKMYPDNRGLIYAANMMCTGRKSNKQYGWLKARFSENQTGPKNHMFGRKNSGRTLTQAQKDHLSKINTGKKSTPLTPAARDKIRKANTGKKFSQERKDNISTAKKGKTTASKGVLKSPEHREKMRLQNLGKTYSAEVNAKKAAPKCSCIVCKKETNIVGITRFHKHTD